MPATKPPELSLVVLQWNNLELTRRCVASLRRQTLATNELIIVDNGSSQEAAAFASVAADKAVLLDTNLGFAAGMNRGLAVACGEIVAFVNNDTVFPASWDSGLLEHFTDETVGMVVPAVSAAGNPVTVRSQPTDEVLRLLPFGEFPSGVVYLIRRDDMVALGGWNERYPVASAEDLDLCFTIWGNGLDIVLDTHTVIDHVSQASVRMLPDREALYRQNLEVFLERWRDPSDVPRLERTDPAIHASSLARAQTAVQWITRMLDARRQSADEREQLSELRQQLSRVKRERADPPQSQRLRRLLRPSRSWLKHVLMRTTRLLRGSNPEG